MAKKLTDDEVDIMRKQRRRLIGAVVLTLAVVVILPMVLDSEPNPASKDIELTIPSPDKVGEFVPVLPGSSISAVETPEVSVSEPANKALAEPVKPSTPASSPATTKPQAKAVSPAPMPVVPKRVETPPATDEFVAQIGAYSNADTARQELKKLKGWGFTKAHTEQAGDVVRVRVGPYSDRGTAEKVALMLEKHGLKPVVISAK